MSAMVSILLAILTPWVAMAQSMNGCLRNTDGVFNQLQRNAWYLPTSDHMARLYVTEIGTGSPVVFVHGGPGNDFHYIIDGIRPQLGLHRFTLYEQRGSLLSPVATTDISKLTIQQQIEDLEALRKTLGIDKMVLFAHSFGTLLALTYYQKYPDHVAGMVLAGAIPPTFKPAGLKGWIKAMRFRQEKLMNRKDLIAEVEKEAGLPADPRRDSPQQASIRWRISGQAPLNIIDLRRWKELTGGMVYYNEKVDDVIGNTMASDFDIRPTLRMHPVPITIINGDDDYIDPAAKSWAPLSGTGYVQLDVMPHASHYSWIDDPVAFGAALRKALARADSAR
ncbi:MAG: alpha/beta hydrolase [Luteimonas sp.]|nr:alpha/beta hydrolase [Luteimonas sp.]